MHGAHIVTGEYLRRLMLCRGNGASVLRIVPYAALNFAAYERIRQLLVERLIPATPEAHQDSLKVHLFCFSGQEQR